MSNPTCAELLSPELATDVEGAMSYTGLGQRTIRRYIAEGKLTAYKTSPHRLRIFYADLDALIERAQSKAS